MTENDQGGGQLRLQADLAGDAGGREALAAWDEDEEPAEDSYDRFTR